MAELIANELMGSDDNSEAFISTKQTKLPPKPSHNTNHPLFALAIHSALCPSKTIWMLMTITTFTVAQVLQHHPLTATSRRLPIEEVKLFWEIFYSY
jgi:hypothetical protein